MQRIRVTRNSWGDYEIPVGTGDITRFLMCGDEVRKYFTVPKKAKNIEIVLTSRERHKDSYELALTKRSSGTQWPYCCVILRRQEDYVGFADRANTIIKAFLQRHKRCFASIDYD